jgi:hypothetical protein
MAQMIEELTDRRIKAHPVKTRVQPRANRFCRFNFAVRLAALVAWFAPVGHPPRLIRTCFSFKVLFFQ